MGGQQNGREKTEGIEIYVDVDKTNDKEIVYECNIEGSQIRGIGVGVCWVR